MARVKAVCISEQKGTRKHEVSSIKVMINHGIVGDAHAGNWHRQISLLADESVEKLRQTGLDLTPGAFAENILTEGIELYSLPVGTKLNVGNAILEVTQIGKECHNDCEIKRISGKCVMPTEGIFAIVIKEGEIFPNDDIQIMENKQ